MSLRGEEKQQLLRLARRGVAAAAAGLHGAPGRLSTDAVLREVGGEPDAIPEELAKPAGVFVSLHKHGELRGCVGVVEARLPLYRAVVETAASAALRDPRFPPVSPDELPELKIEISVLSSPQPLPAPVVPADVRVGVHGLIVTEGRVRGLLLPQVAVERNWSAERFLEEACRKAGLPLDAWRKGARVETFVADVFGED